MKKLFLILNVVVFLVGCTHLVSVSTTSFPKNKDRAKVVKAKGERFIFLGFNFNNNYVDNITYSLADQCRDGKVEGVVTKHENITYFPAFAEMVRVSAQGYCIK